MRLIQGRADRERVYGDDPVARALEWEAAGAPWLHVVDLDGAFGGRPANEAVIARLLGAVRVPVEVGGGIRTPETIERLLAAGAARVILGTAASSPRLLEAACGRFGDRVAVAIDARGGVVVPLVEAEVDAAARVVRAGARRIVYTDTSRDGMLAGPNLAALRALLRAVDVPVIASGGVSSAEDVRRLRALEPSGLEGVVVGRALYEGRARLGDLLAAARPGA